jgi:hypothetical protein
MSCLLASLRAINEKGERPMSKGVPYSNASSDMRAREDIKKVLLHFGCEEIGFADNYEKQEVLLYFKHRGREIHLRASATGWARRWLKKELQKANPARRI